MVLRKARFEKHVDYICYTPTEFENIKDKSSIIMDAVENELQVAWNNFCQAKSKSIYNQTVQFIAILYTHG